MKKLTQHEIARLLATRATPEPPAGLADRIKAEIPGSIQLDRRALQPGRRWLMPPLIEGLQPSWLAAASVLLVLSVGMVAARIPAKPDDVWKWMALSGVVHIDDIVVTAPAPAEPQAVAVAMAQSPASKSVRVAVPSRQKMFGAAGKAERADDLGLVAKDAEERSFAPEPEKVAMIVTPPTEALDLRAGEEKEALGGTRAAAGRAGAAEPDVTMSRVRMSEEIAVSGAPSPISGSARAAAAMNRPRPRPAPARARTR
jgi:hypothetical protein